METASPLTLHLLGAIGLYLAALGGGALIAPDRWAKMIDEMETGAALTTLMGLVAFAIGVALLGVHHERGDPLQIIVTAVGAIAALEGLLILAVPRVMMAIGKPFLARSRLWAIFTAALGVLFIVVGLTGRATLA
jgi:small neutral amino acid transporter SnatA (MarC family)